VSRADASPAEPRAVGGSTPFAPEPPEPAAVASQGHPSAASTHKQRRGLNRLIHATGFSLAGLRTGWGEPAFRLETLIGVPMMVLAFWLGQGWAEISLLAGSVVLVLIVELINTAIEATVDRIGRQWHDLAKRAKDLGSAAVFLALLLCLCIWAGALWARLT
jgi:diacylglycerol kinase (ATP)